MNAVTQQKPANAVAEFSRFMDKLKPQMALALPKHMNADRMSRLALTAFSSTPALQKCSVNSIAASIMTAAQLGLEPGINGQGYLIPYKDTCTFVPGWKGLVDLVARAGRATVWTGAVYPGDKFDYQLGDEPFCRHQPGDGGDQFTHVYAIGRVRDAQMPVIEVWTRGKVNKHLDQYNKVGGRHYAFASESNFEMYARKVALLQVLKYMPSSIELSNALTVSHAAEEGKGVVIEGDFVTVDQSAADGPGADSDGVLPECTPEAFDKKKAGWEKMIRSGAKSVNDLIATIQTKEILSAEQKMEIAGWAVQEGQNNG
jgi:recombination protein RecT